jgi:RNA polymerase-binding transcription factor DksA
MNYASMLEAEKKTLTGELIRLGRHDLKTNTWEAAAETADPSELDPNTIADRFEDFEEKTAIIVPLEARLTQVESALAAIANGTFGICRVCSTKIEEARLSANPAAETCMEHLEA